MADDGAVEAGVRRRAGVQFDESQIPGTVHLVDLEHTAATQHASGSHDIILVPTPSKDPNDPLNWSASRKRLHLTCIMVYVSSLPLYPSPRPIPLAPGSYPIHVLIPLDSSSAMAWPSPSCTRSWFPCRALLA